MRCQAAAMLDSKYPYGYTLSVYQLMSTAEFDEWIRDLSDKKAKAGILVRLEAVKLGQSR